MNDIRIYALEQRAPSGSHRFCQALNVVCVYVCFPVNKPSPLMQAFMAQIVMKIFSVLQYISMFLF